MSFPAQDKLYFVGEVVKGGYSPSFVAKKYGIPVRSLYRWIKIYKSAPSFQKPKSLAPKYLKGRNHPRFIGLATQNTIKRIIVKNPSWGCRKISQELAKSRIRLGYAGVNSFLKKIGAETPEDRNSYRRLWSGPGRIEATIKYSLVKKISDGEDSIANISKDFSIPRRTIQRWIKTYKEIPQAATLGASIFKEAYVRGSAHPRAIYPKLEGKVIEIVRQNPKLSVHKLKPRFPVSSWTIWSILNRNNLNLYSQRLAFAQAQGRVVKPAQRGFLDRIKLVWEEFIPSLAPAPPPSAKLRAISLLKPFLISSVLSFFLSLGISYWVSLLGSSNLGGAIGLTFATLALIMGTIFFLYSIKYYLTLAIVLSFSQTEGGIKENGGVNGKRKGLLNWLLGLGSGNVNGSRGSSGSNGEAGPLGLEPNLEHVKLKRHPFISVHIPFYNEKNVVERAIAASTNFDYQGDYELILCDDSTDETTTIIKDYLKEKAKEGIKVSKGEGWELTEAQIRPGVTLKHLHRTSREGFKGGALKLALKLTNPKAEFVTVFDADFVPYPDILELFLKYFQVTAGTLDSRRKSGMANVAAVQGYQWHVLNKSENWITRGVRAEYAGSYVIERSGEEIYGGLKQISGSVYMIRKDVLNEIGWGTSITEDFQLTLKLYEAGYKVVYTPYIQAPAECVSTIKRLIRQRMRWAEGHSINIKRMFVRLLVGKRQEVNGKKEFIPSPLTFSEKLEFLYLSPYYLQAFLFLVGTISWLISETIFKVHLPFWTELWGWSLVLTNMLSLPLMNAVGLFLEESEERDYIGMASFVALSYILVPFQAYSSLKGFLEKREGPWFRTPKTGRITDVFTRGRFYRFITGIFPTKPLLAESLAHPIIARTIHVNRLFSPIVRARKRGRVMLVGLLLAAILLNYLSFFRPSPIFAAATKIDDAGDPGEMSGAGRQVVRTSSGTLYAFINDGGSCEIWKSTDGSSWTEQDATNNPTCVSSTSIAMAIDASNDLHLVYPTTSSDVNWVKFTTSSDTFGTSEDVSSSAYGLINVSVAIDSNSVPHVAYSLSGDSIRYGNRVGGTWQGATVESTTSADFYGDITISEDNIPEISYVVYYISPEDSDLTAAVGDQNNATSFTLYDVDTTVELYYVTNSIGIDSSGNTWIAYTDGSYYLTLVKHNDADGWSTWQTPITNSNYGHEPSIAIDSPNIYVFYLDDLGNVVYNRRDTDNNTWLGEKVLEAGTYTGGIEAKWSYLNDNQRATQIDYLFSDGVDIYWNTLTTDAKIEQQINIIDQEYSRLSTSYGPTDRSLGLMRWDGSKYSGEAVYFEAVIRNDAAVGSGTCAALFTSAGSQVTGSETCIANATAFTRTRSGAITANLVDGTDYTVRVKSGLATRWVFINSARLIIVQSSSTSLTDTRTEVEVGNVESQSSSTATQLTDKKIYYYDSSKFSPAPTVSLEASLRSSQATIEQQINIVDREYSVLGTTYSPTDRSLGLMRWDGSKYSGEAVYFEAVIRNDAAVGSGTCAALFTSAGSQVTGSETCIANATAFTRTRSGAITANLVDGTDYTVRVKSGLSNRTVYVNSARLIVVQTGSSITTTRSQIEVGNYQTAFTNTTYSALTNYKIYLYDQNRFSATPESSGDVEFHASLKIDDSGDTVYAELFNCGNASTCDPSSGQQVAQVSHTGDTNYTLKIATNVDGDADWDTTNDDNYLVRVRCNDDNGGGCSGNIANAKIVLDQSAGGGVTQVELVHQEINTLATDTDDVYTSKDFLNRFNEGLETDTNLQGTLLGGTFTYYFEATLMTSTGTGYAQLYNRTNSSAIASSEVNTNSTTYARVRSSDITSGLPKYPQVSAKDFDTQLKNSATSGNTTSAASSWLIIQVTNLATSAITAYADLYNVTDSSQVASSEISSSDTAWARVVSGTISLTTGKEYVVRIRSGTNNATIYMANAKIVLDQSAVGGVTALETVELYVNRKKSLSQTGTTAYARLAVAGGAAVSGSTVSTTSTSYSRQRTASGISPSTNNYDTEISLNNTTYTQQDFDNRYDSADWTAGNFTYYFEATLRTPSANNEDISSSWLIIQVSNLQIPENLLIFLPLALFWPALIKRFRLKKPDFMVLTTLQNRMPIMLSRRSVVRTGTKSIL